jgi:hypothetical protein
MIEHHVPEFKQHNINSNLIYNLLFYELLTLNRNRLLTIVGFSNMSLYESNVASERRG